MSDKIKHIYNGVPEQLANKVLWVERKFRINELSHQPGGFDIIIEYFSGNVFAYDWIKKPGFYTGKILENEAKQNELDYDYQDEKIVLAASKRFIKSAYCKYYDNKNKAQSVPFEKVWDATTSCISVVEALMNFENDLSKRFMHKKYEGSKTSFYDIALAYENQDDEYLASKYYKEALTFYQDRIKQGFTNKELLDTIRDVKAKIRDLNDLPF